VEVRIRELWSLEDQVAQVSMLACAERGDLCGALAMAEEPWELRMKIARRAVQRLVEMVQRRAPDPAAEGAREAGLCHVFAHAVSWKSPTEEPGGRPLPVSVSEAFLLRRGTEAMFVVLWLEVARACGVPLCARGLTGRPVLLVGTPPLQRILDPQSPAAELTLQECNLRFRPGQPQEGDGWLVPIPDAALIHHVLGEQLLRADARGRMDHAYRLARWRAALLPADAASRFGLARQAHRAGAHEEARALHRELVERYPGSTWAVRSMQALQRTPTPRLH
jgi:hypothetical protein